MVGLPRYILNRGKEVQARGYYRVKVVCRGTQGRGHFWYGMADLCVWGERYREEQRVEVQGTEGRGHVLCVCVGGGAKLCPKVAQSLAHLTNFDGWHELRRRRRCVCNQFFD